MTGRYAVYTVLGDGVPFDVARTDDPMEALCALNAERLKYAGYSHHAHGISDDQNEEAGDCEARLEEIAFGGEA